MSRFQNNPSTQLRIAILPEYQTKNAFYRNLFRRGTAPEARQLRAFAAGIFAPAVCACDKTNDFNRF